MKSTTLGIVSMLLPLLAFPDKNCRKNIIFMIDKKAVLYGWYKRLVQYLASFLGVTFM